MKKSSKVVMPQQPSEEFYKNMEAIIKEAEALGIDKLVLQKKEPGQPTGEFHMQPNNIPAKPVNSMDTDAGLIKYESCNVTVPVDKVVKSPIFFMENDQHPSTFISLPTPLNVVHEYLNDYISIAEGIQGSNFKKPTRLIDNNNINEFMMIVESNIYAVFYNGLYSFLKPFLTITQDQVATIFDFNKKGRGSIICDFLKFSKPEEMMNSVYLVSVKIATFVGNLYFDFINSILIHGFVNLKEIAAYLAEAQGIPFDKVSEKQYYMFVEGCLLEIASEDVHKIIEIVEANAVYTKCNMSKEDFINWVEDDE